MYAGKRFPLHKTTVYFTTAEKAPHAHDGGEEITVRRKWLPPSAAHRLMTERGLKLNFKGPGSELRGKVADDCEILLCFAAQIVAATETEKLAAHGQRILAVEIVKMAAEGASLDQISEKTLCARQFPEVQCDTPPTFDEIRDASRIAKPRGRRPPNGRPGRPGGHH
mmetsp:Transcript_60987/g.137924  ORF Transcript_60987/g.137924 Transcript_60987/m.137924 type:complete len:167 (+) Transcript_60987:2769-3269(+)